MKQKSLRLSYLLALAIITAVLPVAASADDFVVIELLPVEDEGTFYLRVIVMGTPDADPIVMGTPDGTPIAMGSPDGDPIVMGTPDTDPILMNCGGTTCPSN